jgi:hypothetical protein
MYFLSKFTVGRSDEKEEDIGTYKTIKEVKAAVRAHFFKDFDKQSKEDQQCDKQIWSDVRFVTSFEVKGVKFWDMGSGDLCYCWRKDKFPEVEEFND